MQKDDIELLAVSYEEAAKRLGVCRQTVAKAVKAGILPAIKLGRRTLISKKAIERMLF